MVDPVIALGVFGAVGLAAGGLFWPRVGLFWRWRYGANRGERTLIEDALKHIHACSYRQRKASVQSQAGSLGISLDRSATLLGHMESLGLVTLHNAEAELTPIGRQQVLHVIRVHRLWERYLAEFTSFSQVDWHRDAEQREHTLTPAEIDAVDAQMNFPRYDPHGDPIPTAGGEMLPPEGQPLADMVPGTWARIVHIEDEPEVVYEQIVACRLYPGMVVQVIEATHERIRFSADGEEQVLSPVVATNITVAALPTAEQQSDLDRRHSHLSELQPYEQARVIGISRGCMGLKRERLLDLGIIPGTIITIEFGNPLGDPTAYLIRGAVIALRREQAMQIEVRREPIPEPAPVLEGVSG